jgi:hypothetical protein
MTLGHEAPWLVPATTCIIHPCSWSPGAQFLGTCIPQHTAACTRKLHQKVARRVAALVEPCVPSAVPSTSRHERAIQSSFALCLVIYSLLICGSGHLSSQMMNVQTVGRRNCFKWAVGWVVRL